MAKLSIDELVSRIKMLPPMNQVVQKLLDVMEDQEVSAADVSRVLSSDPAIASKVLALVNSAMYGFSNKISTIDQAVAIIGNKSVRSLALSLSTGDMFKSYSGPIVIEDFWRHSLLTATSAQIIAKRVRYPVPEDAFTAGLLHDIGQLVLSMFVPGVYNEVVDRGLDVMLESEMELLGVNHAVVGALLLEHWKLPPHIVEVVEVHHLTEQILEQQNDLLKITQIAELIASIHSNTPVDCEMSVFADQILAQFDIPPDEYNMLLAKVSNSEQGILEFFGVPPRPSPDLGNSIEDSVVVFGADQFRIKWICSLLKNMGYYAVSADIVDHDSLDSFQPSFAIVDTLHSDEPQIASLEQALTGENIRWGVISEEGRLESDARSIASGRPCLPLAFSAMKLAELLNELNM